jgi:hypothetical protein
MFMIITTAFMFVLKSAQLTWRDLKFYNISVFQMYILCVSLLVIDCKIQPSVNKASPRIFGC